VELTRMLVEAYAVSGQLALATEATSRLAETDPGYRAIAAFGLALARGQTGQAERTQARHAAALGIPGVKTWAARLDLLAIDLQQRRLAVSGQQPDTPRTGLADPQHGLPTIDLHHGPSAEQANHAHVGRRT